MICSVVKSQSEVKIYAVYKKINCKFTPMLFVGLSSYLAVVHSMLSFPYFF